MVGPEVIVRLCNGNSDVTTVVVATGLVVEIGVSRMPVVGVESTVTTSPIAWRTRTVQPGCAPAFLVRSSFRPHPEHHNRAERTDCEQDRNGYLSRWRGQNCGTYSILVTKTVRPGPKNAE